MMTSVESPEGQLPPRAGLPLGCSSSVLQGQDFDFGKRKIYSSTLICVRNFSALLSSVQPASLTLSSSTDVMEIVTRFRLPYKLHYNGSPDLKHTLSHMHMRPAI